MRFPYKPSGVFRFSPPAHPKWRETQTPSMRFPDSRTGSVSPSSSRTTLPTVHCSPRQSLSSVNSGSQLPSTVAHPAGSPTPTSSLRRNSSGRRKPTPRETRPRRSACDAVRAGSPTGRSTLRPAAPTATTRIERPERGPATRSRHLRGTWWLRCQARGCRMLFHGRRDRLLCIDHRTSRRTASKRRPAG
jgi:hypothetical protein